MFYNIFQVHKWLFLWYLGESNVLQYFSNMRLNSETLNVLTEVANLMNHTGFGNAKPTWYSSSATIRIYLVYLFVWWEVSGRTAAVLLDLFKTVPGILLRFPSSFFSIRFVCVQVVHPYISTDTFTAWKKSPFIFSFHLPVQLSGFTLFICLFISMFVGV